jgi:hypothetical protein
MTTETQLAEKLVRVDTVYAGTAQSNYYVLRGGYRDIICSVVRNRFDRDSHLVLHGCAAYSEEDAAAIVEAVRLAAEQMGSIATSQEESA